jgi:hypothetical protein
VTLDGANVTASCATTLPPVSCPAISLSPVTLPGGTAGVVYNAALSAVGGRPIYTFAVTDGTLPAGLGLSTGGVVSGTPTTAGLSAFTIRGTDADACFAELNYTTTVLAPVPTLPQIVLMILAAGLVVAGYLRLRRRA